jgi:hypothetical protein
VRCLSIYLLMVLPSELTSIALFTRHRLWPPLILQPRPCARLCVTRPDERGTVSPQEGECLTGLSNICYAHGCS